MFEQKWILVCAAGTIALIINACTMGTNNKPIVTATPSAPAAQTATTPTPKVALGTFSLIDGTNYLSAPAVVSNLQKNNGGTLFDDYERAKNTKDYSEDIRNYMFVERDTLTTTKLLPDHNTRLLSVDRLGKTAIPQPQPTDKVKYTPAKFLWFVAVPQDTNQDKKLDTRDRQAIAIADVSGANYQVLIKDIDLILLDHARSVDRRLVFYRSNGRDYVADVNLTTRDTSVKELPAI
jgi:hypothetical protein